MSKYSVVESKDAIFVDFFDTIMHRHVHPLDIKKAVKKMDNVHGGGGNSSINKYLEIGSQYPNKKLVNILRSFKEQGKKIYIVSDFDMKKEDYVDFLLAKNINPNLFDDIFISEECHCSKANGDLYPYVLKRLSLAGEQVVMIGDNKKVDGVNAKKYGIDSIIIPHFFHKTLVQIRRFTGYDYKKHAAKEIRGDLYRYGSPFSEYALHFYLFTRELYEKLRERKQREVVFLAREGHFLRRVFDAYGIAFIDDATRIKTYYLRCSRRSAQGLSPSIIDDLEDKSISIYDFLMSLSFSSSRIEEIADRYSIGIEDLHTAKLLKSNTIYQSLISQESFSYLIKERLSENRKAGEAYFQSFCSGDKMNLVDIGWRGTMQETIGEITGKDTMGYYVGLNDSELDLNHRCGIIFNSCPKCGVISQYASILKANTHLYEQLTSAPHGSAIGYEMVDEKPHVLEDWADNERKLYYDRIDSVQKELILNILGMAAWCGGQNYKKLIQLCAKTVLHSGLFANKDRMQFLEALDTGYIWNFGKQEKGLKYNHSGVHIKLDILYRPEQYTRYFVKVQRSIKNKGKIVNVLYYPFAWLIYQYIWTLSWIKGK